MFKEEQENMKVDRKSYMFQSYSILDRIVRKSLSVFYDGRLDLGYCFRWYHPM